MNKTIYVILVMTLLIVTAFTSMATVQTSNIGNLQPPIEWMKTFGTGDEEYCVEMRLTDDGGFILVGHIYTSEPDEDIGLIKTDDEGNQEFGKIFSSTEQEYGDSVAQTNGGGYIIAGGKYIPVIHHQGYWIKTDKNGNKLLEKVYPMAEGPQHCFCVQQTADGGFITVGETYRYSSDSQVWLVKQDAYLNIQWEKNFGSGSRGLWIEITNDGGYIITGSTTSPTHHIQILLAKLDEDGNEEWFKTFGGTDDDCGACVKQTSDGGYIIGGSIGVGSNINLYVIKTDPYGNKEWDKTINNHLARSVSETIDGGYFIVGSTDASPPDLYFVKLDDSGNKEWEEELGDDSKIDRGYSGYQTPEGGYIMAGHTRSYGAGMDDVWLIKLQTENNPPGIPTITGPTNGDVGTSYTYTFTSVDPDGDEIAEYIINWGDGPDETLTGPFASGTPQTESHTWTTGGTFTIKAKAVDIFGAESDWGTLDVTMPRSKAMSSRLLSFLQDHPNMFPLLRVLLQRLRLY